MGLVILLGSFNTIQLARSCDRNRTDDRQNARTNFLFHAYILYSFLLDYSSPSTSLPI